MLAGYYYDGNCILGKAIADRQGSKITEAQTVLNNQFKLAGSLPETYVVENEISKNLFVAFNQEEIDYQLVTPCKHCNNEAEKP